MVQYAGSQDSSLVWNPKVHAYVDRNLYENAMTTQDPHLKSYTGVKPNFGGGLVKEG